MHPWHCCFEIPASLKPQISQWGTKLNYLQVEVKHSHRQAHRNRTKLCLQRNQALNSLGFVRVCEYITRGVLYFIHSDIYRYLNSVTHTLTHPPSSAHTPVLPSKCYHLTHWNWFQVLQDSSNFHLALHTRKKSGLYNQMKARPDLPSSSHPHATSFPIRSQDTGMNLVSMPQATAAFCMGVLYNKYESLGREIGTN